MTRSNTTTTATDISDRHRRLLDVMAAYESVLVAFSAGVDSTLVLKVAVESVGRGRVLAVTGRSPSVARGELRQARALARRIGAEHLVVDTDEFADKNYTSNPTNRCYFCKRTLYHHLAPIAARRGLTTIANGTNTDDLGDWRPGLRAADQHGVRAPLVEADLNKSAVRRLSRALGLPTHDKPAAPCLSSRIPYGHPVTPVKLRAVERAERLIKRRFGLRDCRVRHYGSEARIEAPNPATTFADPTAVAALRVQFRRLGFERVTIDPRGLRSGSLNEVIAFGTRQRGAG